MQDLHVFKFSIIMNPILICFLIRSRRLKFNYILTKKIDHIDLDVILAAVTMMDVADCPFSNRHFSLIQAGAVGSE